MNAFKLALLLGAVAGPAVAQTPADRRITFNEAIEIALRQNISLRQAQNLTVSNAAAVKQARLQFLPDFRANTSTGQSYGRTFSQDEGRIVDQTTNSVTAGVSSAVTLFDGRRNTANLNAAKADEQASTQELTRTRQTVVFTVATNFVALVSNQEQLRVQRENVAAQEAQEAQINAFVQAGTRPISDLYQQQASTAQARAAVVDAQRAVELAKVDIIQTLQLDPAGTYEFVAPVVSDSVAMNRRYDLNTLLQQAFAQRADIDAQEARVAAAQYDVTAARAGRFPSIGLNLGYNTSYNSAADVSFGEQFNQRRGGGITLGLSVPVWDRGSTRLNTQRAEIAVENARLQLENSRQAVALQVRRALLDQNAAQERLNVAIAQQRAAQQAVLATEQRYRVGASTLVELSLARAQLVQAESALVNARYNLVFQQALMTYYTGELQPESVRLGS